MVRVKLEFTVPKVRVQLELESSTNRTLLHEIRGCLGLYMPEIVSLKAFNLWGEVIQVEYQTGTLTRKLSELNLVLKLTFFFIGSQEPFSSVMGWQANAVRRRRWQPIKPPEEPTRWKHYLIMLSWFIALVSGLPKADRGVSFAPSEDEVWLPSKICHISCFGYSSVTLSFHH